MRVWNQHPRTQRLFTYLAAALALALALGQPGRVGRAETAKKSARALAPVFKAQTQPSTDPSVSGRWELQDGQLVREWPLTPVHINLLPDGRVLFWSRDAGVRLGPGVQDLQVGQPLPAELHAARPLPRRRVARADPFRAPDPCGDEPLL
jgi:hypothetical protein